MIEKLKGEIKKAMIARDSKRLLVLRTLMSKVQKRALDDKRKELTDKDMVSAVNQGIRQREESIKSYSDRQDLIDIEKYEIGIYKEYQLKQLSKEEIEIMVNDIIAKKSDDMKGMEFKQKMGIIMKVLKVDIAKGIMNGKLTSGIVMKKLKGV